MGELLLQHELMGVVRVWHGLLYYNVLFVTKCGYEWEERPVLISVSLYIPKPAFLGSVLSYSRS